MRTITYTHITWPKHSSLPLTLIYLDSIQLSRGRIPDNLSEADVFHLVAHVDSLYLRFYCNISVDSRFGWAEIKIFTALRLHLVASGHRFNCHQQLSVV